ncbi:hypothetical protein WG68_08680 [Arsukibacterium ikkense]|uniref:Tyr recombinase domain-containing protein n=1 Tax=Arsukibacterium ikkense TaxID=336831 RepID=A0A0M2V566_9GAMM|nr:tyrosine-type recombinase/integrase [Arsukibacterium ikkense]KKO45781.1 hypothetical protein WG68_08680 [Arsukibacterium ikkense]
MITGNKISKEKTVDSTRKIIGKATDLKIKSLKPQSKPYKNAIDRNLSLIVYPTGVKAFRMRLYKSKGESTKTLGRYPELKLKKAIELANKQRHLQTYPSYQRSDGYSDKTFGECTALWLQTLDVTPKHLKNQSSKIETYLSKEFSNMKLTDISPRMVLNAMIRIQTTGKIELALRCLNIMKQVFGYASLDNKISHIDFSALRKYLKKPKVKNFAAVTTKPKLRQLIHKIRECQSSEVVKLALECGMHWFVRPGELVKLRWSDINHEQNFIAFTPLKNGDPNVIPMSVQTHALLKKLEPLVAGSEFLFQSPVKPINTPIDSGTCTSVLRDFEDVDHVMHGFRATARTMLEEIHRERYQLIEKQLSHKVRDANGRAYNRTEFLEDRTLMMQKWSDFLTELEQAA